MDQLPRVIGMWYVTAPDNTFGERFDWKSVHLFDANGLKDVVRIQEQSVVK